MPKTQDPEMLEFEAALLRSVEQGLRGEYAAVHTPRQIAARKRGRPVGTVKTGGKVSTTIRFDPDLLAALKASGAGWQTRVNEVLREAVRQGKLAA
ncbi:MAG: BrnA antitoxin family protein [Simplicispira sp.]|nr:BrnA antitoxin family protein [Simplicispira sp.]